MSARTLNQAALLAAFLMPLGLACSSSEPARGEVGQGATWEEPSLPPQVQAAESAPSQFPTTDLEVAPRTHAWGMDEHEPLAKVDFKPESVAKEDNRALPAKTNGAENAPPWSTACQKEGACLPETLLESTEGFVSYWAKADLKGADLRERNLAALAAKLASKGELKAWTSAVPVQPQAGQKKAASATLLVAEVEVDQAREVSLRYSILGELEVSLNGASVVKASSKEALLEDHQSVRVALKQGRNQVVLRVAAFEKLGPSFFVRLRELNGQPLADARWYVPKTVAQGEFQACEALELNWERAEQALVIKARARGLVPVSLGVPVKLKADGGQEAELSLQQWLEGAPLQVDIPLSQGAEVWLQGQACQGRAPESTAALQARSERSLAKLSEAQKAAPKDSDSLAYLGEHVRELLYGKAGGGWSAKERVERLSLVLDTLERYLTGILKGEDPYSQPGVHLRAYRSELDGSLQRYVVALPTAYGKREQAWPMVMLAHGLNYTAEDMLAIALQQPQKPGGAHRKHLLFKGLPLPKDSILVANDGFKNAGSKAAGEVDLLAVRQEMLSRYAINPKAITLSGFSLGGSVAFWQALHHPTLFAGAGPLCGYPDLPLYRNIRRFKHKPWEKRMIQEEGVLDYAESGRHLPLYMLHGTQDKPERSEFIHKRYQELGYKTRLDLLNLGHFIWDEAYAKAEFSDWLNAQRQPEVVRNPKVRSGRYRWGQAYWLKIEGLISRERFGELDGQLDEGRVRVKTENVSAFQLVGQYLGEFATRELELIVDGQTLGPVTVKQGLELHLKDGRWVLGKRLIEGKVKQAGQEGPLYDSHYGATLVVYGTQIPEQIEVNRLAAEAHRIHAPWISVKHRVLADTEVSEAELKTHHVVLVGTPDSHKLWPHLQADMAELGLKVDGQRIQLGAKRFEGEDLGLSFIWPSPFVPQRYVVVHTATGIEGILSSRYLPEFSPDFLVYDRGMRATYRDRVLGERQALDGGFFTDAWTLDDSWLKP